MGDMSDASQSRRVRIATTHGEIEGSLRISPILRTLDELNLASRNFITLQDADGAGWNFSGGEMSVNRASVLFLYELSNPPRSSGQKVGGTFARASVRLHIGGYTVEGFIHVPPGGDPMRRLNHNNHPFLSLTSVSVVGPDSQFATPFLAFNHAHVLAAENLRPEAEGETSDDVEMNFELAP